MPISVKELRVSLIWTKVFARDSSLPSICDAEAYTAAFDQATTSPGQPWLLPWLTGRNQHFWQYYLQPVAPTQFQQVSAANARAFFVPLRLSPMADVVAKDGTTVSLEGYCFPHSVAVVATFHVRSRVGLPLQEAAQRAVATRNADFQMEWKDKSPATHGQLQSLADKIVARVHTAAGIDAAAVGKPLGNPISVASFIDASGMESDNGQILADALRATLALRPAWEALKIEIPATTADRDVPQMLPLERGRAVWNPAHFSDVEVKGRHTANGCYHRNLTLASMQAAALAALVGRADEVLENPKGRLLTISSRDVARSIAILRSLSAGDLSTYRSWSLKHQVSFALERMDALAAKLG